MPGGNVGSWPMPRPVLHQLCRCAVFLAIVAILSGAFTTSEMKSAGPLAPTGVHTAAGLAMVLLQLVILIGTCTAPASWKLRLLAGGALFLAFFDGVSFFVPIVHACLAQLFFVAVVCLAVRTSPTWESGAQRFDAKTWPRLPGLSVIALMTVAMQVFLGVAYRQRAIGVSMHLLGALIATLLLVGLGVYVTQTMPHQAALCAAAKRAMTATGVQVALGMTVYMMALVDAGTTLFAVLAIAAHVLTGALMLGASVVLAVQFWRGATVAGN